MATNTNVSPYFDDFNPSKNFHRILFKPGYSVQGRELTQSQTILQNQISQFASAIYSQNTPVSGGKVTTNLNANYIKLNLTYNNSSVDVTLYNGMTITDSTGTILAQVVASSPATGTTTLPGDPPTLIVNYLSGTQFSDGMTLYYVRGTASTAFATTIGTSGGTTSVGNSSIASISDGVFFVVNGYNQIDNGDGTISKYQIGNFVNVLPQTVILDKYDTTPSLRVGLNISENIVTYQDDDTLLDPALGSTNYQAPGADRFQIELTLETRPLTLGNDDGFIELLKINNGQIEKQTDNTVYSTIDDYFAKRTYDTNGDFIVNDFSITPVANTINSAQYDLRVGKGIAYIRGYRLENQSDLIITNDRSRTYLSQNTNPVYIDYGSYFYVDTANGVFDTTVGSMVDLHCVSAANISSTNTTTYSSTVVGKGRIRGLEYDHNSTDANTTSYVFKAYVHDIIANTLSSNATTGTVNTLTFYDTNGKFSSVANSYLGVTLTIDSGTSAGDTRKIVSYNASTKTATVDSNFSVIPTSTSNFTLRFATKDIETVANTTVGTTTVVARASINDAGKLGGIPSGDTIYQNPAVPELIYNIGYPYVRSVNKGLYQTTQVFRNQPFSSGTLTIKLSTLNSSLTSSVIGFSGGTGVLSSDEIKQNFIVIVQTPDANTTTGSVLDFTSSGNTVSISSDENTVTFTSNRYTSPTVTVIAKMNAIDADASVFLKTKTLVSGNTSSVSTAGPDGIISSNTYVDLTKGQVYIKNAALTSVGQVQSLYVTDIKNIVKIIDTGAPGTAPTTAMLSDSAYDVTYKYSFNNGQQDTHYDHAFLTLNPGTSLPKGNILVIFNFYRHGGGDGYFSFTSYLNEAYAQIPSYTSTNGLSYNLRDCLDFRPSRKNGTSNYEYENSYGVSNNYSGTYIPQDLTNWYSNYSYYLARKDKLVLSKDKSFQIIQGTPSITPIYPTEPDGSLLIANLSHDPYTAYIPSETPPGYLPNLSTERVQHRRWTMSDISDLQTRVNNIEYYTTLNNLEQKASNLQVPDANGLNRFKNGILVDDFSSFATADTANPDFSICVDRVAKQMMPTQTVTNYPLQSAVVYETLGNPYDSAAALGFEINRTGKTTNYFTLPYTTTPIVTQQLASNTVNLNPFSTPIYQGVCSMNPPMDNWVDNEKQPDLLIVDPNMKFYLQSNTVNVLDVGNWQTIPGTQYTTTSTTSGGNWRTTTTNTFASQQQTSLLGYWTALGSNYSQTNNFITDISIQPYIRSQQILVKAKGLQINTPISTWFDGVNVDQYMHNPDVIELTGVQGTFKEDDVIGYYDIDKLEFQPIATVVSTVNYANTSNVRLYITSNFHSTYPEIYRGNVLSNAKFNNSGTYVSNTAFGYITKTNVVNIHKTGYLSAVGGTFTEASGTSIKYYFVGGNYGIWGSPTGATAATLPYGKFYFTAPATGSYTLTVTGDDMQAGYIKIDGTTIWTIDTGTYTFSLTAGSHTFEIYAYDYQGDDDQWLSAVITYNGDGRIVLHTRALLANPPLNSGTKINMPNGGYYFVGATQISLLGLADSSNNFYDGCSISVTSTLITQDIYGGSITISPSTYTANIVSYDGPTCTATLDKPINVSLGYNTNYGQITSSYTIDGTYTNYILAVQNGGVDKMSTNEKGEWSGVFVLPPNTFRTGERVFRVDNRFAPEDPSSSTTWAESTFTASGLSTKSQAINFSPSVSAAKNVFTRTQIQNNILIGTSTFTTRWDPVAQTFIIDAENYPNGAYISSAKFFFATKPTDSSAPVTLSIVGTLNGYPNGETLDGSIVTLTPDMVNTSSTPHYLDSTTYTEFTFDAPIYIQPGVLYAFILHSHSTDYNIYTASQNGTAIASSVKNLPTDPTPSAITKIGTAPYVGTLFESQNSITWTAEQTKSLMFVIERCVFDTTANPKIQFTIPKGLPNRKLTTQDIASYYSTSFDYKSNLLGNFTNIDVRSDAYNISTTDFVPTKTSINYTYEPLLASGTYDTEKSVVPGKFGSPTYQNIYLDDGKGNRLLQANNTATFSLYATLSSSDNTVSPIISDDGLSLYNIKYGINNLGLSNNIITLVSGGTGYSNNQSGNVAVSVSLPDSGSDRAQAVANVANGVIENIFITYPGSGYLTAPVITITDANTTPGTGATVNTVSEFSPKGGNATARYVTKKVTLAAGNDSQDLRVFFTAYRPVGTNIYVFYRIQNRNDSQTFENGGWQLMTYVNNTNGFSSSRDNLLEFEVAPGINGYANNQISYTSTSGTSYTSFNQFAIKVVLTSSDTTNVPYLTDIRALALPSGTGI